MHEVSVGDYGRMMFETMVGNGCSASHWESVREKAEPLVRQLLALNGEMTPTGYLIVGYQTTGGKEVLSRGKRIRTAQEKVWGCKVDDLNEGDYFWTTHGSDYEMYVGQEDPAVVEYRKNPTEHTPFYVAAEINDQLVRIYSGEIVLKAPADWEEKEDVYSSDEYWLGQADRLGI